MQIVGTHTKEQTNCDLKIQNGLEFKRPFGFCLSGSLEKVSNLKTSKFNLTKKFIVEYSELRCSGISRLSRQFPLSCHDLVGFK